MEAATDWHITVDLPAMTYKFPTLAAVTTRRPDLVLWSAVAKIIILMELTRLCGA